MSFLLEKEICPACNGEKTIECCSCGAEDCAVIECPYCQGAGVIKHYNMPVVFAITGVALIAVLAVFLLV